MVENLLFIAGKPYERISKKALIDGEVPVFLCEFANGVGGVLTFQNTVKKGESFWVIQKSNNYKKLDVSIEDHLKKKAIEKRNILYAELCNRQNDCIDLKMQIREINESLDLLDVKAPEDE